MGCSLLLPRPLMLLANSLQFGGGVQFALLEGAAREPGGCERFRGLGMATCSLTFGLVRVQSKVERVLVPALFLGVIWIARLGPERIFILSRTAFSSLLFLLLLLIDYRANYGMDYQQQNLIYLSENWPGWGKLVGERKRQLALLQKIWRLNTAGGSW